MKLPKWLAVFARHSTQGPEGRRNMAETTTVEVEHGGQSFSFQLCRRDLDFGTAGPAPYFWMDSRKFRNKKPGTNFRACVDLWWKAVEEYGAANDIDNQVNLVWAECYPLVNTARSLQDVYVDAHLHKMADRQSTGVKAKGSLQVQTERTFSLPEEQITRLRELAADRDTSRIREELEDLFLGEMPSAEEMPAYQEAAQAWIGNGIVAFRQNGRPGLRNYVGEVGEWIQRYRKQGNLDRVRRFVNLFGYESKVAFYLCHTSAWVGLVQKLVADGRLNQIGERFLRLWHHQNQPADDGTPDVFCGQVLSLHPLSAIVQSDAGYLATIGRWLAHPDYDALHQANQVGTCTDYWDVVSTILMAAHEYEHARSHWEASRGSPTYSGTAAPEGAAGDAAPDPVAALLEDYAAERHLVCAKCKQVLAYFNHEGPSEDDDRVRVTFRCRAGHDRSIFITEDELRQPQPKIDDIQE
jgi:hypothetical protein